jgi:hypothetical protein
VHSGHNALPQFRQNPAASTLLCTAQFIARSCSIQQILFVQLSSQSAKKIYAPLNNSRAFLKVFSVHSVLNLLAFLAAPKNHRKKTVDGMLPTTDASMIPVRDWLCPGFGEVCDFSCGFEGEGFCTGGVCEGSDSGCKRVWISYTTRKSFTNFALFANVKCACRFAVRNIVAGLRSACFKCAGETPAVYSKIKIVAATVTNPITNRGCNTAGRHASTFFHPAVCFRGPLVASIIRDTNIGGAASGSSFCIRVTSPPTSATSFAHFAQVAACAAKAAASAGDSVPSR